MHTVDGLQMFVKSIIQHLSAFGRRTAPRYSRSDQFIFAQPVFCACSVTFAPITGAGGEEEEEEVFA